MWKIYGGGVLVLGGIAAFIEAHRHMPVPAPQPEVGVATTASGLTPTAYDLVRIGAWALVIFGVLIAILGLIGYAAGYAASMRSGERPPTAVISANGVGESHEPAATDNVLNAGGTAATRPWDGGSYGEAVEPH